MPDRSTVFLKLKRADTQLCIRGSVDSLYWRQSPFNWSTTLHSSSVKMSLIIISHYMHVHTFHMLTDRFSSFFFLVCTNLTGTAFFYIHKKYKVLKKKYYTTCAPDGLPKCSSIKTSRWTSEGQFKRLWLKHWTVRQIAGLPLKQHQDLQRYTDRISCQRLCLSEEAGLHCML